MKKYLVLTDIHGSIKYAQMAFDKFTQYGCHKILILGDILYHGPRNDLPEGYDPKAVTNLCNEYKRAIYLSMTKSQINVFPSRTVKNRLLHIIY